MKFPYSVCTLIALIAVAACSFACGGSNEMVVTDDLAAMSPEQRAAYEESRREQEEYLRMMEAQTEQAAELMQRGR